MMNCLPPFPISARAYAEMKDALKPAPLFFAALSLHLAGRGSALCLAQQLDKPWIPGVGKPGGRVVQTSWEQHGHPDS